MPPTQITRWGLWGCVGALASAGCGTSSGHAANSDGGSEAGGSEDGPVTCGLTGDIPACPSGMGLTCCFDLMTASGTCVAPSACTAPIQFECASAAACPRTQVCCAEGLVAGSNLVSTCQAKCPDGQLQACQGDAECGGAGACVPLAPGNVGGYAGITMICGPPDAGSPLFDGPTAIDGGASDALDED